MKAIKPITETSRISLRSIYGSLAFASRAMPGSSSVFGVPRRFAHKTIDWFAYNGLLDSGIYSPLSGNSYCSISELSFQKRKQPLHVDPLLAKLNSFVSHSLKLPRFVATIEKGRYIENSFGSIVTDDDTLLQDVSLNNSSWCDDCPNPRLHNAFRRFPGRVNKKFQGPTLALGTPFSSNYHHFLLDTLPRISLLHEAGIKLTEIKAFILDSGGSRFHGEILAELKLDDHKLLVAKRGLHLQSDLLVVPSISEPLCREKIIDYTSEGLEFIRRLLRPKISRTRRRRLLLSRRLAATRRWLEEDDALPYLESIGFERIECENLSVHDQALLFGEAEAVIMPHGGGMANCVFCEPGTKIFELFNPLYVPAFMLSLSTALGLDYIAIAGDTTEKEVQQNAGAESVEVRIAPQRIARILECYL